MAVPKFLFFTVLLSLVGLAFFKVDKLRNTAVVAINKSQDSYHQRTRAPEVEIVVASGKGDDTVWIEDAVPGWGARIYEMNEAQSAALAYVTHIVDNYHRLAAVTIFHHAKRYQMRPDNRVFDSELVLQQLKTDHVMHKGFANLRCDQKIDCPDFILTQHERSWVLNNLDEVAAHFKRELEAILPGEPCPDKVAVPTGSEFAVADWAIRQRSKKDWKRIRQWLIESTHKPALTEGIIDHAWQILFGMKAYECPEPQECSCLTFGVCGDDAAAIQHPMQVKPKSGMPSTARGSKSGRDYAWLQTSPLRKRSE